VVEVLRESDRDGEVHRVATAWDHLKGPRCGLDACSALAAVLLALDLTQHELPLEDVDILGVVALAFPFFELATTRLARAIGSIELEGRLFDHLEQRLLPRPVALLRSLLVALLGARPLFGAAAEDLLVASRELLLELRNLEPQLLRVLALCAEQLLGQLHDLRDEALVFGGKHESCFAQLLDVFLALDVHEQTST